VWLLAGVGVLMGADINAALQSVARLADRQFGQRAHDELPTLLVMTDRTAQGDARELIPHMPRGGILCLRDYEMQGRAAYASVISALARKNHIRFMVAGDVELAVNVGAWGVHIPEGLWRQGVTAQMRARSRGLTISTSVHSAKAARDAAMEGCVRADFVTVSPIFPTRSHPDAVPLGPLGLARILSHLHIPAYALGGVTGSTVARLSGLGACGVAGIRFT